MGITLPTFTPVEDSLFLTLYCWHSTTCLPKPVLSDAMADEIVRELDYPFEQFKVNENFILNIALRAKKLDEVAAGFIRHHPDAVGLDLGAGLDTRVVLNAAPATVDWYRRRLPRRSRPSRARDTRSRYAPTSVSGVTDAEWLNNVPPDLPGLIVADGLMGFLTKEIWVSLMNRLISHFPSGEMVSTATPAFAVWASEARAGHKSVSGLLKFPGVNAPRELDCWNPKLKLIREILLTREPGSPSIRPPSASTTGS